MKSTLKIGGMTCASCARSVETILGHLEGVQNATVSYASHSAIVEYAPRQVSEKQFREAIESIGFEFIAEEVPESVLREKRLKTARNRFLLAAALALPVMVLGMIFMHQAWSKWLSMFLSLPVLVIAGRHFFINAWKRAKHFQTNMDTLVALGTGVAWIYSAINTLFPTLLNAQAHSAHVFFESAVVIIALILLGKWLEERAKAGTGEALEKLASLQVTTATLIRDGKPQTISIEQVKIGDILEVKPGEKIPLDGEITEGETWVDESMITGESRPVGKASGEKVIGATVNQAGSIRFQVQKTGEDTLLSHIIRLVREAQGSKAPVQDLADKISSIFVPVVMALSTLTFILWMIIGGGEVLPQAISAALAVLIIACPCALGLATPTAVTVGIGRAAARGILIRDARHLEAAAGLDTLITDKTGTLTEGKFRVTESIWAETADQGSGKAALLALEQKSEHPLARAIEAFLPAETPAVALTDFESITGRGIRANVNGKIWQAGNEKWVSDSTPISDSLKAFAADAAQKGRSLIWLLCDNTPQAIFALADPLKESAIQAVKRLESQNIRVKMATGDNHAAAKMLAAEAGITDWKAEVLPDDKEAWIQELQNQGHKVAMVGDGINDAPALARADVGIAMGTGTDIAMESAGITLVQGDLSRAPEAIHLARLTLKTIRENLFWAFFYNILMIPLAAGILYPIWGITLDPMIAGGAMAFSSLTVVLNSLRLKIRA